MPGAFPLANETRNCRYSLADRLSALAPPLFSPRVIGTQAPPGISRERKKLSHILIIPLFSSACPRELSRGMILGMTRLYLVISLTMLAINLMMEYGTLTKRRSLAAHILSRIAAAVLTVAAMFALRHFGLLRFYLLRALATFPFYFSCQYLFSESIAQKTFLYFMDYSSNAFISTACLWVTTRLPVGAPEGIVASALYVLIMLFLVPLYFRYLRPRVRQMLYLFRKSNPLYAAFPVLSFAFFAIVFGPVNVDSSLEWFLTMMLYVALTALTYFILFSHFASVYDQFQAENAVAHARSAAVLAEEVLRGGGQGPALAG